MSADRFQPVLEKNRQVKSFPNPEGVDESRPAGISTNAPSQVQAVVQEATCRRSPAAYGDLGSEKTDHRRAEDESAVAIGPRDLQQRHRPEAGPILRLTMAQKKKAQHRDAQIRWPDAGVTGRRPGRTAASSRWPMATKRQERRRAGAGRAPRIKTAHDEAFARRPAPVKARSPPAEAPRRVKHEFKERIFVDDGDDRDWDN